jgi:hypothetical protein
LLLPLLLLLLMLLQQLLDWTACVMLLQEYKRGELAVCNATTIVHERQLEAWLIHTPGKTSTYGVSQVRYDPPSTKFVQ